MQFEKGERWTVTVMCDECDKVVTWFVSVSKAKKLKIRNMADSKWKNTRPN